MTPTKAKPVLVALFLVSLVFMRNLGHAEEISSLKSNTPAQGTNAASLDDLIAIAKRTHTKEAWLAALHRDIENDPEIDGGSGVVFATIYAAVFGIAGAATVFAIYKSRRKKDSA